MSYADFVTRKLSTVCPTGITGRVVLPPSLFDHQRTLTEWALKRGRSAIFADTGLGKSRMELAWADAVHKHTGQPVIILAPLAVAPQTAAEGRAIGIDVAVCRDASDVSPGINITNYDRIHRFDTSIFGGVVLDESSIIKHHDAKTFSTLTEAFRNTPFKLPATATPAPNDWTELGTHAEFLGICTMQEMLAEFFTHDGGDTSVWRLKGHARQLFWRWVVSWGALIRKPSDIGYDDGAYNLPPLHLHEHQVEVDMPTNGMLFAMEAQTLSERRDARRMSMKDRISECVSFVRGLWADPTNSGDRSQEQSEPNAKKHGEQQTRIGSTENEGSDTPWTLSGEPTRQTKPKSGRKGHGATRTTSGNTASARLNTTECLTSSAVDVQSAGAHAPTRPVECSPSITATRRAESEGCFATHATLQSPSCGTIHNSPKEPRNTLEPVLIWCDLNAEQDALKRAFGDLAFSVQGSDSADEKEAAIRGWLAGERPIMISKPSIMGWGLNFQHCRYMAFVGVTDSYEAYYQAVRRCWRFGQKRDVHVHIFSSKAEGAVVANLKRKEREAAQMAESLSAETRDAVMAEVTGSTRQTNAHNASKAVNVPHFLRTA